ncbi:Rrf2 family transcriptional regulator [Telmatospirillum siberiense]|uniref:Rrf2 family transcriptional regulator n=1 Tax=Telmatospirillum siberiense TaxID=382514 RepID=A0A2N3PVA5_9PROT|nr:Rrf2 family transcriptional regulator [Telmatospirillum siberiense]PKU24331.1 Rrf2 family transcriptional regulator [Telmatospirillum siberiense]
MARNCRFAVAVHITAVLALHRDTPATSDWIAGSVNTNPVVVRRILSALAKAGLVTSQRGIAGGSFLARDPEDISLLDLYRAVDEQEAQALHHQPPNPKCPVGAHIVPVLVDILTKAETAKEKELGRISIGDVAAAVKARAAA